jgi:NADPH-dependent curcumin reductase
MKSEMNRCWRLAARPVGMFKDSDFLFGEEQVPQPGEDEILVRTLYLSVDPTQRMWISRDTYMPAVPLGDVVRAFGAGKVVASKHPGYAPGDIVQGLLGWQDYAVLGSTGLPAKVPPGVPLELSLSTFGITGMTAYFGLLEIGRPSAGETVVVSGAAGATGMMVGQIAKIKGCRVIGIAGGAEKCRWITGELGFDAAIDYKVEDVGARLAELCPGAIDIYFDNVGGSILDAALAQLALRGRVVQCGIISEYNATDVAGIKNYTNLLIQRGRLEGFIISDYWSRFGEAAAELGAWLSAGKIKNQIDVQEGLENAPAVLRRLFTGANSGKQLLKVADP